ncbi:NUDIX domain-containing protein [Candidatus Micrarchaeota archaeon]|nr:NUDIX domain-containing protein [Candidatus Micrarchaeota archaeon]
MTTQQRYPEPTVGALIFNRSGQLFLMKSPKWRDRYVIPGGHIELGERMTDALKREIKEETNLTISNLRFVSFSEFIFDAAFWKKSHFIFFDFTCTGHGKVRLNKEGLSHVWVPIRKALSLPLEPYTRKAIKDYLAVNKIGRQPVTI